MQRITERLGGLVFGYDHNPDRADGNIRQGDDLLMREARVNLVTVGVFSRALFEAEEGHDDSSTSLMVAGQTAVTRHTDHRLPDTGHDLLRDGRSARTG
jgi:hypothetical protein